MTNKGGRPRKEIDLDQLERMVSIQCTAEECASLFKVDADTLDARLKENGYAGFSEYYKRHSAEGRKSLRRAQYEAAVDDKNPTMLVWLGKQWLGQSDKHDINGNFNITLGDQVRNL